MPHENSNHQTASTNTAITFTNGKMTNHSAKKVLKDTHKMDNHSAKQVLKDSHMEAENQAYDKAVEEEKNYGSFDVNFRPQRMSREEKLAARLRREMDEQDAQNKAFRAANPDKAIDWSCNDDDWD